MIFNSIEDNNTVIVQTFWETKEYMDRFYSSSNITLSYFNEGFMHLVKTEQTQIYQTDIADIPPAKIP